ncbi:hypothetical protein Fcan01_24264 [Folsomia candida]|uniref:Uncharacterized protein n=1 Tax=Folsomia candida TaxID=158441 RepID=A0A226D8G1_FOLCA|nr:hypothetical protein Fcan01_24264 [Folsomia candida]
MFISRKPQHICVWTIILAHAVYPLGIGRLGSDEENKLKDMNIANYFEPFQNCTIIVKIPAKTTSAIQREDLPPIVLELYGLNRRLITEAKFSLQRRRNPSPHCWASFSIFPERNEKIKFDEPNFYKALGLGPDFIDPFWTRQYFIFVTKMKLRIEHYLKNMKYINSQVFGLREILILASKPPESYLSICYYNSYYIDKPIRGMESSQQWYHI